MESRSSKLGGRTTCPCSSTERTTAGTASTRARQDPLRDPPPAQHAADDDIAALVADHPSARTQERFIVTSDAELIPTAYETPGTDVPPRPGWLLDRLAVSAQSTIFQ